MMAKNLITGQWYKKHAFYNRITSKHLIYFNFVSTVPDAKLNIEYRLGFTITKSFKYLQIVHNWVRI